MAARRDARVRRREWRFLFQECIAITAACRPRSSSAAKQWREKAEKSAGATRAHGRRNKCFKLEMRTSASLARYAARGKRTGCNARATSCLRALEGKPEADGRTANRRAAGLGARTTHAHRATAHAFDSIVKTRRDRIEKID
ncbi:hypothetical protein KTE62_06880 [Burkholderia multivorans]|uniref:hypothetical protein n=1 Tax=Burkholderia multivorans TaxID=87883 RepID=UPI001C235E8D|nr:hypothetical protein [Burkholderia multivorans]MBU9441443.1 hypothetical protein [Burkholderia multivorans]